MKNLFLADWIAPVSGPLLADAAMLTDGQRIADIGARSDLLARHRSVPVTDLGKSLILPGLVNAHTHLELSAAIPGESPRDGFTGWLGRMIESSAARAPADRWR